MSVKFWFVWNKGGYAPTHMHASKTSAKDEAKRLALNHPGKTFVVLESLGEFVKEEAKWTGHAKAAKDSIAIPF